MKLSGVIEALVAAGGTPEQIMAVVRAAETEQETRDRAAAEEAETKRAAKREGAAERKRRQRDRHAVSQHVTRDIDASRVTERDQSVTARDPAPPPSPSPLEPPTPPTPTPMREAARARETASPEGGLEAKLRQAAKAEDNPSPGLCDLSPILGLLDAGFDLERDILPVIRSRPNRKLRSWAWYVDAVRDGADRRQAAASAPAPRPAFLKSLDDPGKPRIDFGGGYSAPEATVVDVLRKGHWLPQWGAKRGEPGCKIPDRLFEEAAA